MKKIKELLKSTPVAVLLVTMSLVGALGLSAVPADNAYAEVSLSDFGENTAKGEGQPTNLFENDGIFKVIINALLFLIGIVSVIMLIIGGFKYTTSNGSQEAVSSAKNTIMYAIIGIVVAVLAFAIVNWVLTSLGAKNS